MPFDAVLMDADAGYRWSRGDPENPPTGAAGLPILAMTANASLADREACGGGHERPCGEADRQSAWCFACSVISAGAAPGAPATAADAGELVEGDIVGRFGGSLELIVQVRRFVPDMQDLFAQLERQLGEGDVEGSAATLHTIKGSASTVGCAPGRPCQRAGAGLRRADPLRGMEILAGIRLDELRTLCDACLLRLQAMFGDVQAESAS